MHANVNIFQVLQLFHHHRFMICPHRMVVADIIMDIRCHLLLPTALLKLMHHQVQPTDPKTLTLSQWLVVTFLQVIRTPQKGYRWMKDWRRNWE